MTFGVVARADESGLASLTREVVRHLNPDRVLLIDMGSLNRGGWHPEWYDDHVTTVTKPLMERSHIMGWLQGLDNVFTAETFYDPRFAQMAVEMGVHRTLYVMPELFDPSRGDQQADTYYLPTPYARLDCPVLPMPVALDRFTPRDPSTPALTFFHLPAAAFHDRNGTEAVLAALPHIDTDIRFVIGGGNQRDDRAWHVGHVEVTWLDGQPADYWDVYPQAIDVFVLPRRYGFLCLPMLEAAALGLPIVSTYLAPQNAWLDDRALCTCSNKYTVGMKGGYFPVYAPDPIDLARRIDALATNADLVEELAKQNRAHAEANSWSVLADTWRKALA